MSRSDEEKILYIARRNKWTLCYLAVITTAILCFNVYYLVKDH